MDRVIDHVLLDIRIVQVPRGLYLLVPYLAVGLVVVLLETLVLIMTPVLLILRLLLLLLMIFP